ncbi:MAG: DUF2075 domain-containing protein [Bacteroidetes bacterium]|nr:DUF2075 domain-containing protein [Bacteroidota bacterium]
MLREFFPTTNIGASIYGGFLHDQNCFCKVFDMKQNLAETLIDINQFLKTNGYEGVQAEEFDETNSYRNEPVTIAPHGYQDQLVLYIERDEVAKTLVDFLINELKRFRDERDWEQFHNPKDLSIALSIEANELLEQFLWKDSSDADAEMVKEELADVFSFALLLLEKYKFNLEEIVIDKIQRNREKYPIAKAKAQLKSIINYRIIMIVYQATKAEFNNDVFNDVIDKRILASFKDRLNRSTAINEIQSWKNSMQYMYKVLSDDTIPDDCGIAIEYEVPQSSKRVDFIITGINEENKEHVIIIELKQWSTASISDKDAIVNTVVNRRLGEHTHPSYQAWSYASLLYGFNETVVSDGINLKPCAYLHNYEPDDVITNEHYKDHLDKAPVYLRGDAGKLRDFIKQYVKYGDNRNILYRIENSRIRPSKMLADSLVKMLKGNPEFVMIDDQKLVYETAVALSMKASEKNKKVLIVKGGPGTGKSVVAINLLVNLTKKGLVTKYVSKNAAPRAVYESRLTGTLRKTEISNLFAGSGAFVTTEPNTFDVLIGDEAHRLNKYSGLYSNLGENQVKEIIRSAKCSIFFIDEDQRVTLKDIGSIQQISIWAHKYDAEIVTMELSSQFRCGGSDGYLAWLDNVLQIRETANYRLEKSDYDFKIFSDPNDLRQAIVEKNKIANKARLVAGYCWRWNSRNDPSKLDVVIPEFNFGMKWNLTNDGSLWIISLDSVNEVGCIHTCQGLEVDYVGVIVGNDMIVRDGKVITDPSKRASSDQSVRGYRQLLETDPVKGKETLRAIIKNTYRTLMTRGIKGCYVYFTDKETERYFRSHLG